MYSNQILLCFQNTWAQQCLNNAYKNSPGFAQQNFQKSPCCLNQIAQNGINYSPQQGNTQQVNYQQQSSIQQASNQPPLNLQQGESQPSVNLMSNSQLLKQPNQDLAANIFSTLYNIKQSAQNQRACNIVKGNPSKQNYEPLPQSQNQPNPPITVSAPVNKPQNIQPSISNLLSEYSQVMPGFTFQFVPNNNIPVQPNQQMFALPLQKASKNEEKQSYSVQSQPITNYMSSQQETVMQSPRVMMPGTQTNTVQHQPIVFTFQSPQGPAAQNQPTLSTTQTSQPILYTMQTQPSSVLNQNQQILEVPSQKQIVNNPSTDKQPLISYVMSQMQNQQGSGNMLSSILPAMLNTKSEKSSSMKALLPLIFNILNEKKNCCGCPHCGCNNSEQPRPDPIINTGYSNHINYSQQKPEEVLAKMTENPDKNIESSSNNTKQENTKVVDNSSETSEEDEAEGNESEEEYEEE